ncbi:hypothetical protein JXB41_06050 [Candidatus Woesearchaeota archaeon]|nr:hypothetical protein [Candidatus Woesearchaeota archaeon]
MHELKNPANESSSLIKDSYKRLINLENNFSNLEKSMDSAMLNWNNKTGFFSDEINLLKKEIENLNNEFKINFDLFLKIIDAFKNSANIDEFEKLKAKIDDWDPESFVSIDEFKRLVIKHIRDS